MGDRWFERWAWVLFLVMPIFQLVEVPYALVTRMPPDSLFFEPLTGRSWEAVERDDPGMARYILAAAVWTYANQFFLAFIIGYVAATHYRRGERWAWFLMASLLAVAWTTAVLRYVLYDVNTFAFGAVFSIPLGLGLLLPLRKFFGRHEKVAEAERPTIPAARP